MKRRLARACLLLLTGGAAAAGGLCFWIQPASFPFDEASLYTLSGGPLLLAILGLVASFAPFDNPRSAQRWAASIAGLATGVALGGLALFTPSFVWLAPPLLLYAWLLVTCARQVSAPEPSGLHDRVGRDEEGDDPSDPFELSTTFFVDRALDESDASPARGKGVRPTLVAFAVLGLVLCWLWRPPAGGARPLPLAAEVASVVSAPQRRRAIATRIRRPETGLLELSGNRVQVQVSLQRPKLLVELRQHTLVIEPCLMVEEGSVDGFFVIPPLNGYTLEPAGLAHVEFVEGERYGWARIEYRSGRALPARGLAGLLPQLGRRAGAGDISATIELELEFDTGRLTIDARTRLGREAAVHRATACYLQLRDPRTDPLQVGIGGGASRLPATPRLDGRWQERVALVASDGRLARLLLGKHGDQGPYETLDLGPFDGWLTLPGRFDPLLLVLPDWSEEASPRPSRGAGYGLPENALLAWRQDGALNVALDLAGTRLGPSRIAAELPVGVYRTRLVLTALGSERPEAAALRELERLGLEAPAPAANEEVTPPGARPAPDTPPARPAPDRPG